MIVAVLILAWFLVAAILMLHDLDTLAEGEEVGAGGSSRASSATGANTTDRRQTA